uniref:Uncharacterized protein n=1 Tax=Podarcis muralis TaxID=64176 RepID=A0A670K1V5_PODMU
MQMVWPSLCLLNGEPYAKTYSQMTLTQSGLEIKRPGDSVTINPFHCQSTLITRKFFLMLTQKLLVT